MLYLVVCRLLALLVLLAGVIVRRRSRFWCSATSWRSSAGRPVGRGWSRLTGSC
jgi:hypothetical protein